jgi:hypothetical protein
VGDIGFLIQGAEVRIPLLGETGAVAQEVANGNFVRSRNGVGNTGGGLHENLWVLEFRKMEQIRKMESIRMGLANSRSLIPCACMSNDQRNRTCYALIIDVPLDHLADSFQSFGGRPTLSGFPTACPCATALFEMAMTNRIRSTHCHPSSSGKFSCPRVLHFPKEPAAIYTVCGARKVGAELFLRLHDLRRPIANGVGNDKTCGMRFAIVLPIGH